MNAKRVLVVDDEKSMVQIFSLILNQAGFLTEAAYDGQHALDVLAADSGFDAVVTGNHMPKMRGSLLARHISNQYLGLPVLLLTASCIDFDELASLPICEYDSKPIQAEHLIILVRAMCFLGDCWRGEGRRVTLLQEYNRVRTQRRGKIDAIESAVSAFIHQTLPEALQLPGGATYPFEVVVLAVQLLWAEHLLQRRNLKQLLERNVSFHITKRAVRSVLLLEVASKHPLDPVMAALVSIPDESDQGRTHTVRLFIMQRELYSGVRRLVVLEKVGNAPGVIVRRCCDSGSKSAVVAAIREVCMNTGMPILPQDAQEPSASRDLRCMRQELVESCYRQLLYRLLRERDDLVWALPAAIDPTVFENLDELDKISYLGGLHLFRKTLARLAASMALLQHMARFKRYIPIGKKLLEIIPEDDDFMSHGARFLVDMHIDSMNEDLKFYERAFLEALLGKYESKEGRTFHPSAFHDWGRPENDVFRHYHELRQAKSPASKVSRDPRDPIYQLFDDLALVFDIG